MKGSLTLPSRYMIPGPTADDQYLMVEDEFLAVAQTFTAHLHHAEYQRLKRQAAANPTTPIFQPTEHMRVQARRKIEARNLRARQKSALKDVTSGAGAGMAVSDEEAEEGQEDEPWQGTSLAGLMTDMSSQKTALVGLEKIQSSTRAARGFGRSFAEGSIWRKEVVDTGENVGDDTERDLGQGGLDDESEIPSRLARHAIPEPARTARVPISRPLRGDARARPVPSTSTSWKHDRLSPISKDRKRSMPAWEKRKARAAKERKMEMHDIPTFLV